MELQQISYNALPSTSPQTAVSLSKRYAEVKTIAQAFRLQERPLAKAEGDVRGSIMLHLAALARFLNLRSTLTDEHIEFIADKMLEDENYKWLKPADLKIFFDRIKQGKYGDFYGNLNSISFFQSLDRYMMERNEVIEQLHIGEAGAHRKANPEDIVLPYFINADGRLEDTPAEKQRKEEERNRQEAIAAESARKKLIAIYETETILQER